MIPGIKKNIFQRIITITIITFIIYKFFGYFNLKSLEISEVSFLYLFVFYGFLLIRKVYFLWRVNCNFEKFLEEIQYYIYVGAVFWILIFNNLGGFIGLKNKIICGILFIFEILFCILFIYFLERNGNEREPIFEKRKEELEYLESILELEGNQTILIEGDWGKGKTYFVDNFLEKNKEKYIHIKIKTSLFSSKKEIRKFIFQEFETILKGYNIRGGEILKILDRIEFNKIKFFKNLLEEKSLLEEDKEKIRKMFKIINNKKIIIVLDDIERIPKIDKRKEIISLLSEFEEYVEIKKLILTDFNMLEIDENYINKYVTMRFELSDIPLEDLVDYLIDEKYKKIFYESILKIQKRILTLYEKDNKVKKIKEKIATSTTKKNEKEDELLKIYNSYIFFTKISRSLENPRFIKNLNNDFIKYRLDQYCLNKNNSDRKDLIEVFILNFLIKENSKSDYELLKSVSNDVFRGLLNLSNNYKENKIIKFLKNEIYSLERSKIFEYFLKGFKIITKEDDYIRKTEEIFDKYKEKNLEQYDLLEDLKIVLDTQKYTDQIKTEKYDEFYSKYREALEEFYDSDRIDLLDYLYIFFYEGFYDYRGIKINVSNTRLDFTKIKNDYNAGIRFNKLDKRLWWNYKDLLLGFFNKYPIEILSTGEMDDFIYTQTIINMVEEKFSVLKSRSEIIDKMLDILDGKKIEYSIPENEKQLKSLKENLEFLKKLYEQKNENYILQDSKKDIEHFELDDLHELLNSPGYTYKEFQEDKKEIEKKLGVYLKIYYENKIKSRSMNT